MAALFTWNKDGTAVKVVFGEHVDPRTGHSGLTWNKQRQHFCCYDHGTAQLCCHNGAKNFLKSHSNMLDSYDYLPDKYYGVPKIGMQGRQLCTKPRHILQIRRQLPEWSTTCLFKFKQLRTLCNSKLKLWQFLISINKGRDLIYWFSIFWLFPPHPKNSSTMFIDLLDFSTLLLVSRTFVLPPILFPFLGFKRDERVFRV